MSVNPAQPMWIQNSASGAQSLYQQAMSAAAKALDTSTATLMSDLRSGQSLAQIAQSQGMNTSDLVSGIVSALQQSGSVPGGLSTSQLTQIVTNLVNATPVQRSAAAGGAAGASVPRAPLLLLNGGGSATPSLFQSVMGSAAQTLNTSTQALLNDLASGQSLAQVAQSQGMNANDLVNSIVSALQSSGGGSANPAGSSLTQMVTDLVNTVPGQAGAAGGPLVLNLQG